MTQPGPPDKPRESAISVLVGGVIIISGLSVVGLIASMSGWTMLLFGLALGSAALLIRQMPAPFKWVALVAAAFYLGWGAYRLIAGL